jgi:GntR family transcriptional regulator/MocR family aminotransferase
MRSEHGSPERVVQTGAKPSLEGRFDFDGRPAPAAATRLGRPAPPADRDLAARRHPHRSPAASGAQLPPTRRFARELGVSRGVVVEAYQQLVAECYLAAHPGGYTRVAIGRERAAVASVPMRAPTARVDVCRCRADGSQFPRAARLRSMRRVLAVASAEDFGYVSGRGAPALHAALAEYLDRVRGTYASAEDIAICNGYAQGIALVVQMLVRTDATRLVVEDPRAADDAVPVARAAGLDVVGVPVDEHGVRIDALERTDADALVLTPSHQWPTGAIETTRTRRRA